jgi:hypothetical protein
MSGAATEPVTDLLEQNGVRVELALVGPDYSQCANQWL